MNVPPTLPRFTAHDLERIIDDPELFSMKKSDRSTTVGILKGSALGLQEDLFVKRFNDKGALRFLAKLIFGSRARRVWKVNQRMYERGLPVPKPVAYREPTLRYRHGYLISTVIDRAERLSHGYRSGTFTTSRSRTGYLAQAIATWHRTGAVHGDLKWPNILVREQGDTQEFFFVDLDRARLYRRPNLRGIVRDLERFYRSGLEMDAQDWVDSQFFPAYLAALGAQTRRSIDLDRVRKRALREWQKRGRPRL